MKESQLDNKTSIATNDYVRMVDENNNSVKIKKDSFMAAIRDALPSIISDGATGAGSVLSIINGALKTRTDANLASVLGGVFDLHFSGEMQISANSSGTFTMPSYGVFAIMEYGTQGAFGIFGVVGDALIEINSNHYGVAGSDELFEISKSGYTYTITSRSGRTTRHAVLGFVHV